MPKAYLNEVAKAKAKTATKTCVRHVKQKEMETQRERKSGKKREVKR